MKAEPSFRAEALPFVQHPDHETVWAIAAGPDGRIHIAVCCEATGGGTVQLYAYDVAEGVTHALDAAKALGEDPDDGHASHGKVHFALCPSADGWVYAGTHCSTPPKGDTSWNARLMWNHPQKSFSGGHLFRYLPSTGACEDLGIPYPNQGIPALALDESLDVLVGVTYPAARAFVVGRDGSGFTDLGRVSEDYPLSLVLDGEGHAYVSDTYGFLVRIHLREPRIELLPSRVPAPAGGAGMAASMSDCVVGPDGYIYGVGYQVPNLFRFRSCPAGPVAVEDLGPILSGSTACFPRGLVFGRDGCLYAALWSPYDPADQPELVRYDPEAREGVSLGALTVDSVPRRYWRAVLGPDGRIYAGECGRKPVSLLIIDPGQTARPGQVDGTGSCSEQVDIVSIHGLRTSAAVAEMRSSHAASGCVSRGQVAGVGLVWPPPSVLPVDSAAVTALGVAPSGEVWGATSGRQAHLFRMPEPLQVGAVGPIEGTRRVADQLVFDRRGRVYGAGRDVGGQLFSYEIENSVLWIYINFSGGIEMHGPVFDDDGVATLAVSSDCTTLAGVGDRFGRVFIREFASGEGTVIEPPGGGPGAAPVLVPAADGGFLGADRNGELFRLGRGGQLDGTGLVVPGDGALTSLIATRGADVYAGTRDGRLFRVVLDARGGEVIDCGRPSVVPCLHSLVELPDGRICGIAGSPDDLAHLVCYSPASGHCDDLGLLRCHGRFPWTAFTLGPMVSGRDGELIVGENDRFGHVFIYHPEPSTQ